jgi:histidine triad (HIT) family protein
MDDCIFCKIVGKEIPVDPIYEDEDVIAFLDIRPVNKGHVVLISKKHFENLFETPDEVLTKLIISTKKIGKAIRKALNSDKVVVVVWGEDVSHTHIHLIPKNKDDSLHFWKQGSYEEREVDEITEKIRLSF